jgi:hypothetical protein
VCALPSYSDPAGLHLHFPRRDRVAPLANSRTDEPRPQTPSPSGVCASNLDYTFLRIEIGRSHLQADEETNHDHRPHRLLVSALPSYSDPARLHLHFPRRDRVAALANSQTDKPRPQTPSPSGVCATNLEYTFFLRIEIGRSHLQADKEPNHDRRPHRLLVCALPSYSDPGRLHLHFPPRDRVAAPAN